MIVYSQGRDDDPDRSKYLKGLMSYGSPKRTGDRQRLANDDVTLKYLEAGVRLMRAAFKSPEGAKLLFNWLKIENVQREAEEAGPLETDNAFRHRWKDKEQYIRDVLAHSLNINQWLPYFHATDDSRAALLTSNDFPSAAHEIAYSDVAAALECDATRVGLIAAALADGEPGLKESLLEMYEEMTNLWSGFYLDVFTAMGLKLRPDVDLLDFTYILSAVSEGLQLRLLAGRDPRIIDHEKRRSLLGIAG